jgi:hypothetical protein
MDIINTRRRFVISCSFLGTKVMICNSHRSVLIPRNSLFGTKSPLDDLQSCILFIFLLKQLIMKRGLLSIYLLIATLFLGNVSSAQNVILGSGTAISVFSPINRTNDYCVYEVIYLQSQIALPGTISTIGFQRFDGTNTDSIENVRIYLKHTNLSQIAAGTYDTTGYTQVFAGSFPNDAGAGWREVALSTPFVYDNVNNLQVLVVKDYQPAIANTPVTPRWLYTNISPCSRESPTLLWGSSNNCFNKSHNHFLHQQCTIDFFIYGCC